MKARPMAMVVLLALAAIFANRFASLRGSLVSQREAINAEWLQLDAAFQNRAALIVRLAERLKGVEAGQIPAFTEIAAASSVLSAGAGPEARSPQEKIQANERLSAALARLLVASENYPKLRSDKTLTRLQEEIGTAESQVAVERRKYNELLEHYNAQIQEFPYNVVAGVSGFTRNDAYFKTAGGVL